MIEIKRDYIAIVCSIIFQADRIDEQRCDPPDFLSKKEETQMMVRN